MELDLDGYCGKQHPDRGLATSETRYFPPGQGRRKVITRQYLTRSAAKKARKHGPQDCAVPAPYDRPPALITGSRVAPDLFLRGDERARNQHPQRIWRLEVSEGRDLARSQVPLPYSGQGPIRRPTLEREEAFWDPTTRKKLNTHLADSVASVVSDDVDPETAQLYQMGLLYDDEHHRGPGFTLDSIVHDEPAYTLRPAKRQRRAKTSSRYGLGLPQAGLPLNLSFAQLHNDDTIARFLISPSPSETHADWETWTSHSEAIASVHSLHTSHAGDDFPRSQDTVMTDTVPDLIHDCFDEPPTTQTPEFDCDSDTTSLSVSDADLVILPLDVALGKDERIEQSTTSTRRDSIPTFDDDDAASWIMLGDDS